MVPETTALPARRLLTVMISALLLLAGCASAPKPPAPESGQEEIQRQARKPVTPLTAPQQQLLNDALQASQEQQWSQAEASLRELLTERPDHPRVLARLGWVLQQVGDRDAAQARYREALELDPGDAMTVNNLALMLMEEKRFPEAAELLREGLGYSPDVPELHYNLGVVSELYLLDLESALRHYRRYRDLAENEDKAVAGWIADLERRLD